MQTTVTVKESVLWLEWTAEGQGGGPGWVRAELGEDEAAGALWAGGVFSSKWDVKLEEGFTKNYSPDNREKFAFLNFTLHRSAVRSRDLPLAALPMTFTVFAGAWIHEGKLLRQSWWASL